MDLGTFFYTIFGIRSMLPGGGPEQAHPAATTAVQGFEFEVRRCARTRHGPLVCEVAITNRRSVRRIFLFAAFQPQSYFADRNGRRTAATRVRIAGVSDSGGAGADVPAGVSVCAEMEFEAPDGAVKALAELSISFEANDQRARAVFQDIALRED
jgi:hypothetical protein